MDNIFWSDQFKIGISSIDEQHKKLFDIFNNFINSKESMDAHQIEVLFNALIRYSNIHFTDEEKLMKRIKYPYIEEHQKEHDYFVNELQRIYNEIDSGNINSTFEIAVFLSKWLKNHILISDKKIANYI